MNVTVATMRVWGVMIAAHLVACSEISLRISVEHPTNSTVALTKVSVYESPNLRCQDIAAARVSSDDVAAALVAEQSTTASGEVTGSLADLSRVDHKVIVARGYDEAGQWITAGCAEQDEIEEATVVAITTKPTVIAATVLDVDANDPFAAIIATTDLTGKGVADRAVGWTVYGPAGSEPIKPSGVTTTIPATWEPTRASCTQPSGAALLHPSPPNVVGGYSVQLRAEWAVGLPTPYSRFIASFGGKQLSPPSGAKRFCAARRKGGVARIVCLDGNVARDFEVTVASGQVNLVPRDSTPIGAEALNVVSIASGADRDVYGVTTRGFLQPLFGAPSADNSAAPCSDGSCEIDDVLAVPSCSATAPGRLLMHVRKTGDNQLKILNARGGGTQDIPIGSLAAAISVELDNAGCVTRVDTKGGASTVQQVITYHVGTRNALGELVMLSTRAAYNCSAASCMMNELFPGSGAAFTSGTEPHMLTTFVDASGVVISHVVMAPDAPLRDLFVERERTPTAGVPARVLTGRFDADSDLDLFWEISGRRGTTFEVAYGRRVGDTRLEALSAVQSISVTSLDVLDFNADGFDDILIVGQLAANTPAVVVLPMNAPGPALSIPDDAACD